MSSILNTDSRFQCSNSTENPTLHSETFHLWISNIRIVLTNRGSTDQCDQYNSPENYRMTCINSKHMLQEESVEFTDKPDHDEKIKSESPSKSKAVKPIDFYPTFWGELKNCSFEFTSGCPNVPGI